MPVTRFCDVEHISIFGTGSFSRRETDVRRKVFCRSKPIKIANFCYYTQRSYRLDAKETGEFMHVIFIGFTRGEFIDPFVKAFYLIGKIIISKKVLCQYLRIKAFRFKVP